MLRGVFFAQAKHSLLTLGDKCRAGGKQRLAGSAFETDRNWIFEPRSTAARPEKSQSILALVRRVDGRLVWQADQAGEKVNCRVDGLSKRSTRVTVSLELSVLKVQRLVT